MTHQPLVAATELPIFSRMTQRDEMWRKVWDLALKNVSPWGLIPGSFDTLIMRHEEDDFEVLASYHPWSSHRWGSGEIRHFIDIEKFPEGLRLTEEESEICRPWLTQNFRQSQGTIIEAGEKRGVIDIRVHCDVCTEHGPDLLSRMPPWYERSANEIRNIVLKVSELRGL